MKSRNYSILFLAAVMSAVFVSCGSDSVQGTDFDTTGVAADTTAAETVVDDGLLHDSLGDISFEGETFNMWLSYNELVGYSIEEPTGEVFDDAVYERNRAVEERLGIKLVYTYSGHPFSGTGYSLGCQDIRTNVMAGDDTFDVYQQVQNGAVGALINEGFFVDWMTVPNVDLTKDYWYQNAIENINYGTKVYRLTGFYENSILDATTCIYFNKNILQSMDVAYPYDDVLAGTWTIDKLMEIISQTTSDLNGDSKLKRTQDQYGHLGRSWNTPPALFIGLGGDLIAKNEQNQPTDVIMNERNVAIIERLLALHKPKEGSEIVDSTEEMIQLFHDSHAATAHGELGYSFHYYRDMEDDFGFVPYPKLDEAQESYYSYIRGSAALSYIPVTNKNLEMTGAVLEVMACESYNRVVPAYVDVVLTTKMTRDTESEQMIPIILDTATFYDHVLVDFDVVQCYMKNSSLTVEYAKQENYIESIIEGLIEVYN